MAELVDALVLGASGETRESSNLSFRTTSLSRHSGAVISRQTLIRSEGRSRLSEADDWNHNN